MSEHAHGGNGHRFLKESGTDEQVAFLNSILESSTEYSIVATDLAGTIVAWNEGARRIYGYAAADVIGRATVALLHHPDDVRSGQAKAILDEALRTGKFEGEFRRMRKSGEQFTAHVGITLRRGVSGDPIGYLLISKDITAQKALEEELRRKNEELVEQSAGAAEAGARPNARSDTRPPATAGVRPETRPVGRPAATKAGAPAVLVVDDDLESQKLVETALTELGYRPVCMPDGESGLAAATKERPAAVVLDLRMPGTSGLEFLSRFRHTDSGSHTPVIVWTRASYLTSQDQSRLAEAAPLVVLKGRGGVEPLVKALQTCLPASP